MQGSWRATYLACNPACGRPSLTAADLPSPAPVPGFSSHALYRSGQGQWEHRRHGGLRVQCPTECSGTPCCCRRWYRCHVDVASFVPAPAPAPELAASSVVPAAALPPPPPLSPSMPYLDASSLTADEFEERFDLPGLPAMLGGLTASWGSLESWQPASLAAHFGDRLFKISKPNYAGGGACRRRPHPRELLPGRFRASACPLTSACPCCCCCCCC